MKFDLPIMSKIFCDPIHGQMVFHPVCVAIIDTPQFQRLRYIKQTGFSDYVYPGATHYRFGHSLGVCYLAGKFIRHLRNRQPDLGISDIEVLCIEIAGLCHDLGHGPFSHLWETFVNNASCHRNLKQTWTHEKVSENMLDHLFRKNAHRLKLTEHGIKENEIHLIQQLIKGERNPGDIPIDKSKAFLYQIVNNDDSGLDVDKWDYFLRDCHYFGLPCNFEYNRIMKSSKVLPVNGRMQICFRDKLLECVYNMFRTRCNLHRLAYQHRVVKVYESMFRDAVYEADEKIVTPSGEKLCFWEVSMAAAFGTGITLSNALDKYCQFTDHFLLVALKQMNSMDPNLHSVASFIAAIEKSSSGFYQHISLKISPILLDEKGILRDMEQHLEDATAEILLSQPEFEGILSLPVTISHVNIAVASIHWGKKDKNPVQWVHFYSKDRPIRVKNINREESSVILPQAFEEIHVHCASKRADPFAVQVIRRCFEMYWQEKMRTGVSHL